LKPLTLLFSLALSLSAFGQRVSGKLVDSLSGEPVRNATLYIDQTQIITQSDANGRFSINLPHSPSTILITHVGYQKRVATIAYSKDSFLIKLFPRKDVMEEVTVNAKVNWEKDWKRWGHVFIEYFIGPDMEKKCVLLNPEVLKFRFDKSQMMLKAWARRPLLLENKQLGYIIHVDLDSFYYSFRNAIFTYKQSRYFEPVRGANGEQQKTLAANRLKAYGGSEMHFMRAMYKNTFAQEGFRLYKYTGEENAEKKRIRQQVSQKEFEQGKIGPVDFSTKGRDSLKYYKEVMAEPLMFFKDSVRLKMENRRFKDDAGFVRLYLNSDTFLLEYDPAANQEISSKPLKRWASLKEPGQYADEVYNFLQKTRPEIRYSLLAMTKDNALYIRDNGKVENNGSLIMQGFLAVRRMAYDLPWDYDPNKDYVQIADESPSGETLVAQRIQFTLEEIAKQHAATEMYLHLDKTVYDHNENIWFAAYLLRSAADVDDHQTLYVFLKDKQRKQKIASQQFVMRSGYGAGYLFIADSIPPGSYKLVAYTNVYLRDQNPVVFEQDITIRPYAASFAVNYSESRNKVSKDSVYINFEVKNEKGLYAAGATVSYQLTSEEKNIASGKQKVNDYGELIVGLPLREVLGKKLTLETNIVLKNLNATLKTPVLVQGDYARLNYYPEGGDVVDGLLSRVLIELKDLDNKPLAVPGMLLENGKPIDTFKTDASGVASIELIPHAAARYSVQLLDSIKILEDVFPQILKEGYILRVNEGLIKDSLHIRIASTNPQAMVYVLVHNYKKEYFFEEVYLNKGQQIITYPGDQVGPGLATVTIFNDKGMPVAERCIYKQAVSEPKLKITIDSAAYGNRSKLVARITSTDASGKPVPALVSVSCALARRIDATKFRDIVSFNYLNAYSTAGLVSGNPHTISENYLLVQGWTRYGWQSMSAVKNTKQNFTLIQKGKVLFAGKQLKKPVEVLLFKPDGYATIKTDDKGNFEVPADMMTVEADWKINFAVNGERKEGFSIIFENDNEELQNMLASVNAPDAATILPSPEEKPEPGVLAPVIVKARLGGESLGSSTAQEICPDWVYMYNILNCRNHPNGRKPQIGRTYYQVSADGNRLESVTYNGCTTGVGTIAKQESIVFQLNGRYYNKEFYVADYAKFNPEFPEKFTTVYWNPLILTNEKGEATITFYTNDLKGRMALIAQGVTDAGPVSARTEFLVK